MSKKVCRTGWLSEKSSAGGYRYGFNGKENDNEVKGEGNQQDYGMRVYDPRLGKFLSVDPLTQDFPWYTPYQFAGNKPIWAIDLDGAEEVTTTPEVEVGNVYVRPNGRMGIGPGYSLGGLPGGFSTLDVPGLRTLTTDEFDALIPPHGGFSLDRNKAGAGLQA